MTKNYSLLVSGAFREDWATRSLELIDRYARRTGLMPLVLLPHDIQVEDYAPAYEVHYAEAAELALVRLLGSDRSAPRLVFIDFAPQIVPGELLLDLMRTCLRGGGLEESVVVVHTPDPEPFATSAFSDRRHRA